MAIFRPFSQKMHEPAVSRHVTIWPFASRFCLSTVELEPRADSADRPTRGKCGVFGRRSRARLIQYLATVRHDVLPWFLTLTYPADWPLEWNAWKSHLDRFFNHFLTRDTLHNRLPVGGVWKLEPQQRGAPHFHAIVYGYDGGRSVAELGVAWSKVIGTNCPHHLKYGLSFSPARSVRGVMAYAGKKYLGKSVVLPNGWERVGRYWGVFGRKFVPVSQSFSASLSERGWYRLRRLMRASLRSKGVRLDFRCLNFYTQHHRQWARAFAWAEGELVQTVDFIGSSSPEDSLSAQPF